MKQKTIIMGLVIVLLVHYEMISQVTSRRIGKEGFPKFLNSKFFSQTPFISIEPFDLEKIKHEDAEDAKLGYTPRLGRSRIVDIGLKSGAWYNSQLGHHWQIGIRSEKAKGFMLVFDEFILPEGAELFIYNSRKTILMGAITRESNNKSYRFSSDLIEGDSIFLELIESPMAFKKTKLHLESILYVYSLSPNSEVSDSPKDDLIKCHKDIRCPEGNDWIAQSNAVSMIFDPVRGRVCSGTLLNNACNNLNPTFLTAFHCADFDKTLDNGVRVLNANEVQRTSDWVFRFGYKAVTCGGGDNPQWQTISNCVVSAQSESSDGLLLQLNSRPNAQSGINYAGWTINTPDLTQITAIGHPAGHPMKISISNNNKVFQNQQIGAFIVTNAISTIWGLNNGAAQGGTSGSAYFDQNQRVVGQHAGGFGSCLNKRGWGGTIAQAFGNFGVVLTDDPLVRQTNTVGIPSFTFPDVICGPTPLSIDWNGMSNMNMQGGSLLGITGSSVVSATQLWFQPVSNFSGSGFLSINFKPNGITCNTPLVISKDFQVGLQTPQVSFEDDGGCYGWLTVDNPLPGYTYSWKVTRGPNWYTYYSNGPTAFLQNWGSNYAWMAYELTTTNACGSTTVIGNGNLSGCNGPYLKGNDGSINALTSKVYKPTLSISPNPATSEVTLNLKEMSPILMNTLCDVNIVNQMGQTVVSQKLIVENAIRLDISQLTNGFYVAQVKGENGLFLSQKLIVNRK
jgi:Secretion system C-terminal sorting domain